MTKPPLKTNKTLKRDAMHLTPEKKYKIKNHQSKASFNTLPSFKQKPALQKS